MIEYTKKTLQSLKDFNIKDEREVGIAALSSVRFDKKNLIERGEVNINTYAQYMYNSQYNHFWDPDRNLHVLISKSYDTSRNNIRYFLDENFTILHRDDGPAALTLNQSNRVISFGWVKNGILHRDENLPQEVCSNPYSGSPNVEKILYMKNGHGHRLDGPSKVYFSHSGFFSGFFNTINWEQEGKLHNLNGPSLITFSHHWKNGFTSIRSILFYKNNKRHKLDGPALLEFNYNENLIRSIYYVNGKRLDRRKFPYMKDGKIYGRVLKHRGLLMKAALFDREYGQFLRENINPDLLEK